MASRPSKGQMHGNLTEGPILKTLILFSVPTLIANVLQSLSGTINSIWVGRPVSYTHLTLPTNREV
jgi:Na+-driven multidrug efflux pump